MSEIAQIILAVGAALAAVLYALNGPLATVLNRGAAQQPAKQHGAISRREWWLVAALGMSALSGLGNVLSRVL